jgi:hypothetical protein
MTVAEIVAASRKAQGLPERVEDAATLARLAALLQNETPVCKSVRKRRAGVERKHTHDRIPT